MPTEIAHARVHEASEASARLAGEGASSFGSLGQARWRGHGGLRKPPRASGSSTRRAGEASARPCSRIKSRSPRPLGAGARASRLGHVTRRELDERAVHSLRRRLGRPKLGSFKPLADFDWAWPRRIDKARVESLMTLDFLQRAHNVVLVGPHGLRKTTLAQNVAYQALMAGHTVRMITTSDLLLDLDAAEQTRKLERRLRY